jgi:hypothetical protein
MQRWLVGLGSALVLVCGTVVAVRLSDGGEVQLGIAAPAKRQAESVSQAQPPRSGGMHPGIWGSAVSVAPRVGTPRTVFRLRVPTSPPNRGARDNYPAIELRGPGGRNCRGELRARFGLGFGHDDDAARTGFQVRLIPPQRQDPLTLPGKPAYDRSLQAQPWCRGRYSLAVVELRFKDGRPLRRLARRAFQVRRSSAPPRPPRDTSHGATHAHVSKAIIGTPHGQFLARFGRPKTVPARYRLSFGRPCLYYDVVFEDADTGAPLSSVWQFCLRRGRVYSAGGSPAIPLLTH